MAKIDGLNELQNKEKELSMKMLELEKQLANAEKEDPARKDLEAEKAKVSSELAEVKEQISEKLKIDPEKIPEHFGHDNVSENREVQQNNAAELRSAPTTQAKAFEKAVQEITTGEKELGLIKSEVGIPNPEHAPKLDLHPDPAGSLATGALVGGVLAAKVLQDGVEKAAEKMQEVKEAVVEKYENYKEQVEEAKQKEEQKGVNEKFDKELEDINKSAKSQMAYIEKKYPDPAEKDTKVAELEKTMEAVRQQVEKERQQELDRQRQREQQDKDRTR